MQLVAVNSQANGKEPDKQLNKVLTYFVEYTCKDLPKSNNSTGLWSAETHESEQHKICKLPSSILRKRPTGSDFRLERAKRNYRPPKKPRPQSPKPLNVSQLASDASATKFEFLRPQKSDQHEAKQPESGSMLQFNVNPPKFGPKADDTAQAEKSPALNAAKPPQPPAFTFGSTESKPLFGTATGKDSTKPPETASSLNEPTPSKGYGSVPASMNSVLSFNSSSAGSAPSFQFGEPSESKPAEKPTENVKSVGSAFGSKPAENDNKPAFTFGSVGADVQKKPSIESKRTDPSPSMPTFDANTATPGSGFTFGANSATSSTPFSFGANSRADTSAQTNNPLFGGATSNPLMGGSTAPGRKIAPLRRSRR